MPVLDVPTRWSSTFYMLQFYSSKCKAIHGTSLVHTLPVDSEEILQLGSLAHVISVVLSQFEAVIRIAEVDQYPTLAHVPVWIHKLQQAVEVNQFSDSVIVQSLKKTLNSQLQSYLGKILTTVNLALKAAALHPHYGHLEFISEDVRNEVWTFLEIELQNFSSNEMKPKSTTFSQPGIQLLQRKIFLAGIRELFEKKPPDLHERDSNGQPSLDPLKWWSDWDEGRAIWPLDQMFLAILAISAPAERVFSSAGFIKSEHRNRLSSEHLEECIIIRDFLRYKIDSQQDRQTAADNLFDTMFEQYFVKDDNVEVTNVFGENDVEEEDNDDDDD